MDTYRTHAARLVSHHDGDHLAVIVAFYTFAQRVYRAHCTPGCEALGPTMRDLDRLATSVEETAEVREKLTERVERADAALATLAAENTELAATLLNEQGKGTPPSAGWLPRGDCWEKPAPDDGRIGVRMPLARAWSGAFWTRQTGLVTYGAGDTKRAAMKAADLTLDNALAAVTAGLETK